MSTDKLTLEVLLAAKDKITGPLKAVMGGSSATAKALKAAKDQLKGLNDEQKRIDSFRAAAKGIAIHRQELSKAEETIRTISKTMKEAAFPTRDMQKAFKEATETANHLKGNITKLTEKQERLRRELSASGADTHKLASYQRELKTRTADATQSVERQTAAMSRQNEQLRRLHAAKAAYDKSMARRNAYASAGVGMIATGAAIGSPVLKTAIEFAKAEDSATQLKVAMMGANSVMKEGFAEINALANKFGDRLPGTTSDFMDMMTVLIRQGSKAEEILGGVGEATANLGVLLKMPMTAAAEFSQKMKDATSTTEADMMGLMDVIQRTFYIGVDSNNMLEAFKGLSPAMDMIKRQGLDGVKALAPFVVMMDQTGMRGESAGNAIRKVVARSLDVDKIQKVQDNLQKKKGIKLNLDFTDGKGEFGGIDKMMSELMKLKSFNTVQRIDILKDIYGDDKETNEVLSKIIDRGKEGYAKVLADMSAQASLQERVNLQLGTLKNLWDAASGTFTNALVALGESIAPELKLLTVILGDVAAGVKAFTKEHPILTSVLMKTASIIAIVVTVLGGMALVISGIIGTIAVFKFVVLSVGGALMTLGTVLTFIATLASAHPILALITGIALGAMLIWANWDSIKAKFSGLMAWFGGMWASLKSLFTTGSMEIGRYIIQGITAGLDLMTGGLFSKITGVASGITDAAKGALGIKSPSRVFAEIGGYTMAGLENGLLGGKDGPLSAVLSTVKALTAAGAGMVIGGAALAMPLDTRPPIGGAAAGGMGGGAATYIINVYPQAGSNAQDIAKEVEKAMAQIEARRQAGQRSSLRDKD